MAVAIATKVDALRIDFGSAARLADMLGVSRAQVTRWLRGSGIDPLNHAMPKVGVEPTRPARATGF